MLARVPQVEKFAKFWICKAKLLARSRPFDVTGLYTAAVCAGATVSEAPPWHLAGFWGVSGAAPAAAGKALWSHCSRFIPRKPFSSAGRAQAGPRGGWGGLCGVGAGAGSSVTAALCQSGQRSFSPWWD